MRAVGLDLGSKRVGVAICDSAGTVATPYEVLERSGDRAAEHRAVARIVQEVEAEIVVVGLPRSMSGHEGPAAQAARSEAAELAAALPVPVELHDERLTTVTAHRQMMELGIDGRSRRRSVDKVAAAVMLQSWLEGRTR